MSPEEQYLPQARKTKYINELQFQYVMLNTKAILEPKIDSDGLRISIMSRHTMNDGFTPHPKITCASYDQWLPILAPPSKLLGDYYKRGLPWDQFEKEYLKYIKQPNIKIEVQNIAKRSLVSTISLLCIEKSPEYCHRRILAEECKRYQPSLFQKIK